MLNALSIFWTALADLLTMFGRVVNTADNVVAVAQMHSSELLKKTQLELDTEYKKLERESALLLEQQD